MPINLCILTLFIFTFHCHGQSQTSPDRSILLDLKKHFLNSPNISHHWTSSSDHCTWLGITCHKGFVTKIQLGGLIINDTIPPFICDLKNLTHLDLNNNNIPGSFPAFLYNCSKLEYLDLSFNNLSGIIPDNISLLFPRLEVLKLSSNWFVGGVPAGIEGLKGLKELQLAGLFTNGSFPPEIGNLLNLEVLVLSQNSFSPQEIPPSFAQLKKLRHLWMKEANLIGKIPENISSMEALEYLDLCQNELSGNIPSDFFLLKNLTTVFLYTNRLSGPIPNPVMALNLNGIDFSDNSLTGSIPEDFGKLTKLEGLDLFMNQLSGKIPVGIGRLPALSSIQLFMNNLAGELPPDLGRFSKLKVFDVSTNHLTGSLPHGLCYNKVLYGIYAFDNNLTGELPKSLEDCNTMSAVRVERNNLSGTIPNGLWTIGPLTRLLISNNQFTGQLPQKVAPNLSLLDIGHNQFSGEIPEGLWTAENLEVLQINNNQFTGQLPQKMASNLYIVDISNNRFSGEIPDGVWTSGQLKWLFIKNNQFTGQLPKSITSNLSLLDISNNQFFGEIPPAISSWSNLYFFSASNNLLTGQIPHELTALRSLSVLRLDGNKLSGNFPSNIISWESLSTLTCSRNQLSGTIPPALSLLVNLNQLDLSENQFSGEIPPEIGHLAVSSLNLSSNHLSGKIPDEFEVVSFRKSFLNNPGLCATTPSLGLRDCRAKTEKSKLIAIIGSIVAFLFLVAILYMVHVFKIRRLEEKKRKEALVQHWKLTPFHTLNFMESDILPNLAEDNMVGSGGSGKVYVVALRTGEKVAVKSIRNNYKLCEKVFLAEVKILGTIRHSNIVKLWCCISSEESKLLVYEYMENRSLDLWLHAKRRSPGQFLDWPTRLRIAIGAAKGLSYMHHNCSPPIVHRDVKSSNVLLDSDFNAKIADFGLAKILINHGDPNTVSTVAGSFGYIAPEYSYTKKVNEKFDVYSFGVILLELVTGREPIDGDMGCGLADWARYHVQEGNQIVDALDGDIKEAENNLDEMCGVFRLGIFCTGSNPAKRPTMRKVLQILLYCSPPSPN
ncbi:receptor-like protein kinase HSL1 [Ipomoea triloba]|uniref:receptor-like protein kinase HSL1 n=1 Tax=Ipomoea triloba TaxID=35885 RepID=UPI00125D6A84|nr:receptor-like protein kinase HSL1 [Ipomoea triloba]